MSFADVQAHAAVHVNRAIPPGGDRPEYYMQARTYCGCGFGKPPSNAAIFCFGLAEAVFETAALASARGALAGS